MFIIGNPKNSQHCFYPGTTYGSLFPLHGFQPFASDGKALLTILSTPLRQAPPCFTNSTSIHFYLCTLLYVVPHLECAPKVSLLRYQARKNFQPFCIKPGVPAITTTHRILKHMYIMNFIPRPCLQKEEQTD